MREQRRRTHQRPLLAPRRPAPSPSARATRSAPSKRCGSAGCCAGGGGGCLLKARAEREGGALFWWWLASFFGLGRVSWANEAFVRAVRLRNINLCFSLQSWSPKGKEGEIVCAAAPGGQAFEPLVGRGARRKQEGRGERGALSIGLPPGPSSCLAPSPTLSRPFVRTEHTLRLLLIVATAIVSLVTQKGRKWLIKKIYKGKKAGRARAPSFFSPSLVFFFRACAVAPSPSSFLRFRSS